MTQQVRARASRIRSLSGLLSLLMPAIFWLGPSCAHASSPGYGALPVTSQVVTSIAKAPNSGFWVQTDGDVSVISETLAVDGAPGTRMSRFAAALLLSRAATVIGL